MKKGKWRIEPCTGVSYLRKVKNFLFIEFERIFGEEIVYKNDCTIYNDFSGGNPQFLLKESKIKLTQKNLVYWAQTIYQLSHEFGHYAMRACRDTHFYLSWYEEIFCEALSFYFLDWASKNWNLCELCEISPAFNVSIKKYLNDMILKSGNDFFRSCDTVEKLKDYEKNHVYNRPTHFHETKALFYQMQLFPEDIKELCNYQKYLKEDKVVINFIKWRKDDPFNKLLLVMQTLQPCWSE